ncbi:MAG: hypothetical protein ACRDGL_10805 [Candidatus Limnocylindrales bacterium]
MIVVLGRPRTVKRGPDGSEGAGGLAARLALAGARAGAGVELAGSVGGDAAGDALAVALTDGGVGHAALLRIPGAATPREGSDDPLPRLEAADVELALGYLPECRVLVLAESLPDETLEVALDAARFHGASVVAVLPAGEEPSRRLADAATVLAGPAGEAADGAFADLVGGYAAGLDRGAPAEEAFAAARQAVGWEPSV